MTKTTKTRSLKYLVTSSLCVLLASTSAYGDVSKSQKVAIDKIRELFPGDDNNALSQKIWDDEASKPAFSNVKHVKNILQEYNSTKASASAYGALSTKQKNAIKSTKTSSIGSTTPKSVIRLPKEGLDPIVEGAGSGTSSDDKSQEAANTFSANAPTPQAKLGIQLPKTGGSANGTPLATEGTAENAKTIRSKGKLPTVLEEVPKVETVVDTVPKYPSDTASNSSDTASKQPLADTVNILLAKATRLSSDASSATTKEPLPPLQLQKVMILALNLCVVIAKLSRLNPT